LGVSGTAFRILVDLRGGKDMRYAKCVSEDDGFIIRVLAE